MSRHVYDEKLGRVVRVDPPELRAMQTVHLIERYDGECDECRKPEWVPVAHLLNEQAVDRWFADLGMKPYGFDITKMSNGNDVYRTVTVEVKG